MKVLVIGGGGREHALVWKLAQSPAVKEIVAAPGNAGIARLARCAPVTAGDVDGLARLAADERIDLTVVGPEAPLVAGIADRFAERGLRVFGFSAAGARLEGSKAWAKEFMRRHRIPTGTFRVFSDPGEARAAIDAGEPPFVVKADGLAAGKGVIIAASRAEAIAAVDAVMREREFGAAGDRIVVEEYLSGDEISVLALFDGRSYRLFAPSRDHKRAFDGDAGPNTGGMGAYAPVREFDAALAEEVRATIVEPTFEGMQAEGIAGAGVLYFGLMVTRSGPRVLEYNCRFGDPETQAILPLFDGDLASVMEAAARGRLDEAPFETSAFSSACVVVASGGYPGEYRTGLPIAGLDRAEAEGCVVFHAGTASRDGAVVTAGGRVLGVTAVGATLREAVETAYRGAAAVRFEGSFYRRDIGKKGLL